MRTVLRIGVYGFREMTHASLFTGIGGFDLAASWVGWENIFQCEIDPFCQKVLKYHFPQCELFTDIKTTDFTKYANTIDVISGGFPCFVKGKYKGTWKCNRAANRISNF